MPQISIVIPFSGCEKSLETTLVSVLENRPGRSEIIVAHPGNYSDPYELADEVRFEALDPSQFSLAGVLSHLLPSIHAPVLHLLGCGVQVHPGWTQEATQSFEDAYVGSACPVLLDQQDAIHSIGVENSTTYGNRFLARGKRLSKSEYTQYEPVGPSQLAAFYRTEGLRQISCLTDFSDALFGLEIGLSLEAIGFENRVIPSSVLTTRNEFPNGSGQVSQKAIWRFAGSMGFFLGLALSSLATLEDLLRAPFSPGARQSLRQRLGHLVDTRSARAFTEFVDQAEGPLPEGATLSLAQREWNLAGSTPERRAA